MAATTQETTTSTTTTTAPVYSQIHALEITIQHDNYAHETGWMLRSAAGSILLEQPAGKFTENEGISTKTMIVKNGTYEFEIFDTYGDGSW